MYSGSYKHQPSTHRSEQFSSSQVKTLVFVPFSRWPIVCDQIGVRGVNCFNPGSGGWMFCRRVHHPSEGEGSAATQASEIATAPHYMHVCTYVGGSRVQWSTCGRLRMEEMACRTQEIMCIRRAECDRQRPIVWLFSAQSCRGEAGCREPVWMYPKVLYIHVHVQIM